MEAAAARWAWDYWIDAGQRGFLFLDVMRERAQQYRDHQAKPVPHVLKFSCQLVMDGRKLRRPVNYALVRVSPPAGIEIDPRKRPFVVIDPRAGHGPGIGGFKADSEIGVALKAGHPCYFVGFLPAPMPGQTIEDIANAEIAFLERIIELHAEADGKPAVIGNCQAGWAVMMVAAKRPDLFGPIILAGSPISYWAGVRGQSPMRYTGGLVGGSWLTAFMSDVGAGTFDGAWLVTNFENLNPSNTLWTKAYNLYSKIDTEAPRYLEFEEWWGGHVLLNAEEMQFIVDKLFIGNKLSSGEIKFSDGSPIDLRSIRSPIVVFCSKGDTITPPQQALGWIVDLYGSVDDIRTHGQTIVYSVHGSIGHLGIFVSGSVAKKEHDEFASNIDLIDTLPPGLYEAVLTPKDPNDPTAYLVGGDYLIRFESRSIEDIRTLGANSLEDDREFAAAARISEINLGLYRTFVQPWVKLWANPSMSEWLQRLHPARLQYEIASPVGVTVPALTSLVEQVKSDRRPVSDDNPFWQAQARFSEFMISFLDGYQDCRDKWQEQWFHAVYGSPVVQAMVGLSGSELDPRPKPEMNAAYRVLVELRIAELRGNIALGGPREAAVRALLYVRMPEGAIDERSLAILRRARVDAGSEISLQAFKQMVREQFFMLLLDQRAALDAIPVMLARDTDCAAAMKERLHSVLNVVGLGSSVGKSRLAAIDDLFDVALNRRSAPANGSHQVQAAASRSEQARRRPV